MSFMDMKTKLAGLMAQCLTDTWPVSYTHLKGEISSTLLQAIISTRNWGISARTEISVACLYPLSSARISVQYLSTESSALVCVALWLLSVSYTHLDVYKRQRE